jgi:nitrite reductase/ring-hydroxylating ferredoxin subunit
MSAQRPRKRVRVASLASLPPGTRRVVAIGTREIGVFNVDGELHALPNVCVHQWAPLCFGEVTGTIVASEETGWKPQWTREGEILVCPWHSAEFDIKTGECLSIPGRRVRKYEVFSDGDDVFLYV